MHCTSESIEPPEAGLKLRGGTGQREVGSSVVTGAEVNSATQRNTLQRILTRLKHCNVQGERALESLNRDVGAPVRQVVVHRRQMLEVQVAACTSHTVDIFDREVSSQAALEEPRKTMCQRHRRGHVLKRLARGRAEET